MDNDFRYRFLKAFAAKGITAAELSRQSGINKVAIHKYIKGICVPKQDKCYLLAKALDVDPGWLMTGEEPISIPQGNPIVIPDSEVFKKIMMSLSAKDYETVMEIFTRAEAELRAKGEL